MVKALSTLSLASAMAVTAAPAALAQSGNSYGYHMMDGWGGWFMGPIMMLLVFGLLILGVVLVLRALGIGDSTHSKGNSQDRALEILKERFARGEIDEEEYQNRKKHLRD
ncbi:MAG: SHOCT domain-containing protein [Pseudomonadota bacterium]|uniref:SHOCT domain-containing protein n=1 Tax=Fodinicurvata fenggangensis TaxID=1121830 RepID=UPI00068F6C86|nr:SHOCT domain-containing protein [Fodinicurvata fenggangensis]